MTRRSFSFERVRSVLWWTFVAAALLTAWVADDAYISFRTVERVLAGEGFTWNPGERVQAFTHPLWFFVHLGARWLTGEMYWTTLILCLACSLAVARTLAFRLAASAEVGTAVLVVLLGSRAWMDYTSSGLENPLSHVLLLLFVCAWKRHDLPRMAFLASLLGLNRIDLLALVLPALAYDGWSASWRVRLRAGGILVAPLLAWELFSLVQFGALVPNTALAKLGTGLGLAPRMLQGVYFLVGTLVHDGLTVLVLAWLIRDAVLRRDWRSRALASGACLYILYLVGIGGDSMMGRFFTPPLALLLVWRAGEPLPSLPRIRAAVVLVAFMGLRLVTTSLSDAVDSVGVGDERRVWVAYTGLVEGLLKRPWPEARWRTVVGVDCEPGRCTVIRAQVGLSGYFADPAVYVVDSMTLADPFRARLPGLIESPWNVPGFLGWRPAHVARPLPAGYLSTVRSGENQIEDPDLARVWDAVSLVARGPLWSKERWEAIWQLNTGALDDEVARWAARHPEFYPAGTPFGPK